MARSSRESAIRHPLTAMLGVDSNIRVLRVLSQHGGMLASNEIVRRSRLVQQSVRTALITLDSLGIVASSGSGRSRVYRLDTDHYFAPALSNLFKAESDRFTAIMESVRQSAVGMPFFSLFFYGSAARAEDRPDSDLDIGIVAQAGELASTVEGLREGLRDAAEKLAFLPNVVGLDFNDIRRLDDEADPWWTNVRQEAIVISGKRPEDVISYNGEGRG
jgi:predicted nucleotidyltransferase